MCNAEEKRSFSISDIIALFRSAGIRVKVCDQGRKFRVYTTPDKPFDKPVALSIVAANGFTNALGEPGGTFLTSYELYIYKPGQAYQKPK